MKIIKILFTFLLSVSAFCTVSAQENFVKKRVAVLNFEDKTNARHSFYGRRTIGDEVRDMITTELVKSGKFRVIERERLEALLKEQDLGKTGIITPESAAQIGKILGVELAVFGAVTEMGNKSGSKDLKLDGIGLNLGKNSVVMAIDLRIVNTSTGEILAAENIRKKKSGVSGGVRLKGMNFSDKDKFDDSIYGKVARKVVERVVKLLTESAADMPWSAKVITFNQNKVYINSGKQDGIQIGKAFKVFRPGEALIDPDTGLNLGSVEQEVGTIKVIDNSVGEGKASVCQVLQGSSFEKGDVVRMK